MSGQGPKNIPASIRAKLLNVSRPTGEDFNVTLVRYAVERFLYRLSQSRHRSSFVLKGAMLMVMWTANSRMKDFYDLWFISRYFSFDGNTLSRAISATFERRKTDFPKVPLSEFLHTFLQDDLKKTQWQTFIQRADLADTTPEFDQVLEQLSIFLSTPLEAAAENKMIYLCWDQCGPRSEALWKNKSEARLP